MLKRTYIMILTSCPLLISPVSAKPKGVRLGYMGHLTLMSEDVISALEHYPPDLRILIAHYAPVPAWEEYVHGRYHETKKKDTALLGGGKPVIAPGQQRPGGARWKADEVEPPAAGATNSGAEGESRGEFKRASSNRPVRESSADFGPAPVGVDDDEDEDGGPPQVRVTVYPSLYLSDGLYAVRSLPRAGDANIATV
jgi:serine/threonine-protein phosphatase 6 regulatory subunit 3